MIDRDALIEKAAAALEGAYADWERRVFSDDEGVRESEYEAMARAVLPVIWCVDCGFDLGGGEP